MTSLPVYGLHIVISLILSIVMIVSVINLLVKKEQIRRGLSLSLMFVSLILLGLAVWNLTFYLDDIEFDWLTIERFSWVIAMVVTSVLCATVYLSPSKNRTQSI